MNYYLSALKKYSDFTGRARRKEFWFFTVINSMVVFGLGVVEGLLWGISILGAIYSLAMLIPGLAVSVRRLHDTDRSGWFILLGLIPLIGSIIIFVFDVLDSDEGENRFGPNPKEVI